MDVAATWEPIDSLTPHPKNPRHNDGAVDDVAESIRTFGFGSPIIARMDDRVIIAGHTRWKAAAKLGMDKVPVRFMDLDPARAAALMLADNKLGELAEWDDALLSELAAEHDLDLTTLGWSDEEAAGLLGSGEEVKEETDEPPPLDDGPPDSQPGVVYALGPHRLACGDSTKAETWAAVMAGERLQMVWTDPPYGVSYVGKTKDALTIANDTLDNDGLDTFLGAAFDALLTAAAPGAAVYVAGPPGPPGTPYAVQLLARGMFRQRLAWVKSAMVLGYSDYHYRHEDIYFGYVPGAGRRGRGADGWFSDNAQTTVLEFAKPARNDEHPTMKPVPLVEYCINNSSKPGWLVGDPFGGSGTTLIACAMTGRVARLIELDPKYCDVIRRRWTRWARENGRDPGPGALEARDG